MKQKYGSFPTSIDEKRNRNYLQCRSKQYKQEDMDYEKE
jgi:hypothetical protein